MTSMEAQPRILVCWDVDLTLIRGGGFSLEIIQLAFNRLTGSWPQDLPDMPGRTDRGISIDLLTMHDRPGDELDTYLAYLQGAAEDLTDRLRATGSVLPGALDAVGALAAGAGVVAQTVVTGNMRPVAEIKLATLGADRHINFDIGGYGDTTVHRHELVETARQRAQAAFDATIAASGVVVLGDTPRDIRAAHKAGARAIGVATGHHGVDDLAAADADVVLADLSDTAQVLDAIIGSANGPLSGATR